MIRTDSDRPTRMPAVFLSHGAPWLADDDLWTTELAAWSDDMPRPSAILVVSAHWEAAPLAIMRARFLAAIVSHPCTSFAL